MWARGTGSTVLISSAVEMSVLTLVKRIIMPVNLTLRLSESP